MKIERETEEQKLRAEYFALDRELEESKLRGRGITNFLSDLSSIVWRCGMDVDLWSGKNRIPQILEKQKAISARLSELEKADLLAAPGQVAALLDSVDPDILRKAMPLPGSVITMLFTDIVNSTGEKAKMGDEPYYDLLKKHHALIREIISSHGGHELKTVGDAFIVSFANPKDALSSAMEIQSRFAENQIPTQNGSIQVRIGLHTGTPIVYRDEASRKCDLSGSDVDKAARIVSLAQGGQVLLSEETKILAKPEKAYDWGLWELKGLGPQRIFEALRNGQKPQEPVGKRR